MSDPKPLLAPLHPAIVAPRLWSAQGFIPDAWRLLADEDALPADVGVIVSLTRWREVTATRAAGERRFGVLVQPNENIDRARDDISRLALVALTFPKFTDGRAYSTARRLREQWHYRGELRACGNILLDQIPLMQRCGFDTFEICHAATIRRLERDPAPAITKAYQGSATSTGAAPSRRTSTQLPLAAE